MLSRVDLSAQRMMLQVDIYESSSTGQYLQTCMGGKGDKHWEVNGVEITKTLENSCDYDGARSTLELG